MPSVHVQSIGQIELCLSKHTEFIPLGFHNDDENGNDDNDNDDDNDDDDALDRIHRK